MKSNNVPNISNAIKRSLRRTLVLVNREWAMVNETCFIVHHSRLTIDQQNVQVCDATVVAMKNQKPGT